MMILLFVRYSYPDMTKQLGKKFHLTVDKGSFTDSEIIVMLGENGTGKTTFIKVAFVGWFLDFA